MPQAHTPGTGLAVPCSCWGLTAPSSRRATGDVTAQTSPELPASSIAPAQNSQPQAAPGFCAAFIASNPGLA